MEGVLLRKRKEKGGGEGTVQLLLFWLHLHPVEVMFLKQPHRTSGFNSNMWNSHTQIILTWSRAGNWSGGGSSHCVSWQQGWQQSEVEVVILWERLKISVVCFYVSFYRFSVQAQEKLGWHLSLLLSWIPARLGQSRLLVFVWLHPAGNVFFFLQDTDFVTVHLFTCLSFQQTVISMYSTC